jgi:hypothetical protein
MVNPIEQLDALEKLSKTSVGIMMILGYTELAIGFLVIYASTMDIVIRDKISFGLGGMLVLISVVMIFLSFITTAKREALSRYDESVEDTIQMLKDRLDLYVKLIEYNEKAIRFNEKYKEPKMQTLTYDDLAKIVELHIESYPTTLFKKS